MKISTLINNFDMKPLTDIKDRDITGCYIGDLLSWVMGRATMGDAWITIMNNINVVAVASLTDAACVILCEGVTLDDNVTEKANSEGISILSTEKTAYQVALLLGGEL